MPHYSKKLLPPQNHQQIKKNCLHKKSEKIKSLLRKKRC